ncbi:MAG: ABC transporter substrate-binding protein [Oceanipulchritudo sp.]
MTVLLLVGCGRAGPGEQTGTLPDRVVLQTDWFPQPEHGGFYQALARGFYEEAGLEVEILPGGPNAMSTQKVLRGTAHFAMNRADMVFSLASRGVPVRMVMSTLQHDPQAVMLHAENPVNRLEDLDGATVMAVPGLTWIKWLEARYSIRLKIIPHDFGIERFLNDPGFIQQCLVTNEPFYVRQAGVEAKVLPLRESGFDPYHGIYCLDSFAEANPDVVRRFVHASIRGWRDYILNDPAPALRMISALNPKMSPGFMEFSHGALRSENLVTGEDPTGARVGRLEPARLEALAREMKSLGLVEEDGPSAWYTTEFLP